MVPSIYLVCFRKNTKSTNITKFKYKKRKKLYTKFDDDLMVESKSKSHNTISLSILNCIHISFFPELIFPFVTIYLKKFI